MAEVRQLTVRSRYESIPTITHFVGEAAQIAGLSEKDTFHCQMAVDEACTNVIEHAYGGKDAGDIEVTCLIETGAFTIQIVDHGQSFDPAIVLPPRVDQTLDDVKPGGIGLHLMRKLMDEVRFEFGEQSNTLIMVKMPSTDKEPSHDIVPMRKTDHDIWIVMPEGRLDATTAPHLEQALKGLLDDGQIWLVVDMEQVSYISSRGLKELVSAWRTAQDAGGKVVLCTIMSRVRTIFETVGFTQIFEICQTVDEALAAIKSAKTGS